MKSPFRHLRLTLIICVGTAGLAYAFWPRPVPVELVQAAYGPLRVTVDEDGKTRVRDRFVVYAPLSGQLLRIVLRAGDDVEAGQTLLATIEPEDPKLLDARSRSEAEVRVRVAQAAQEQAAARLAESREDHEIAAHDFTRAQSLLPTKAISQADFDKAEHDERRTAHALRSAEFGQRVAEHELELANAALLRSRPAEPGAPADNRLEIRSPIGGQVLRVLQESARFVTPGLPLLELGDPAELEIEIDVLSADAATILPGARVLLEHWGGSVPLEVRVRLVEPSGFTKISSLGVEEQRVNVIADFVSPPDQRLSLGDAFRVEARIVVWETERALKIPAGCLFRHQQQWAVFAVEHSVARLRIVEIGHNNGLEAEVINGLQVGSLLIPHPGDRIQDGTWLRGSL